MLTKPGNFTGFAVNHMTEFNPFSVLSAKKEQDEGFIYGSEKGRSHAGMDGDLARAGFFSVMIDKLVVSVPGTLRAELTRQSWKIFSRMPGFL
jgi:hypothetical protein